MYLKNKKSELFQWDCDQVVVFDEIDSEGEDLYEAHFANRKSEVAYATNIKDNEATIPNVLLQDSLPIMVYVYKISDEGLGYTDFRKEFKVIPRTRPEDYIYAETEFRLLDKKVDKFWGIENSGRIIGVGNNGYLISLDIEPNGTIHGKDGFSPVVETASNGKGYKITITDAEGPHEFNIYNGEPTTVNGKSGPEIYLEPQDIGAAAIENTVEQDELLDLIWPVGSIYLTTSDSVDPNSSFGGTWAKKENLLEEVISWERIE